jgi:hypothetical protein
MEEADADGFFTKDFFGYIGWANIYLG